MKLTQAIAADRRFFDVGTFTISATVSGELLHKEDAFSVATTFEAQILHRQESLYIAILAGTRLYNRLRLTAVLGIIDAAALRMPVRALCFAGPAGEERWRDGLLLTVSSDETCVIRVPSLSHPELTVPWERVIPKLNRTHINRVARQRGSNTRIEQLIKKLHTDGVKNEGETTYDRSVAICREYIAPLFPLTIGEARVELFTETTELLSVGATTVAGTFARRAPADGHAEPFQSVVTGLRRTRFETVRDCPVGTCRA